MVRAGAETDFNKYVISLAKDTVGKIEQAGVRRSFLRGGACPEPLGTNLQGRGLSWEWPVLLEEEAGGLEPGLGHQG